MSLDRYVNKEDILASNPLQPVTPIKWTEELAAAGYFNETIIPLSTTSNWFRPMRDSIVEIHLYSTNDGSYVDSTQVPLRVDGQIDGININAEELARNLSIKTGQYICVFNPLQSRIGTSVHPALYIEEISTDRTELYLRGLTTYPRYAEELANIEDGFLFAPAHSSIPPGGQFNDGDKNRNTTGYLNDIHQDIKDGNIVLNFGKNRLSTVLAKKTWEDPDGLVVKLLKPLPPDLNETDKCWINFELAESIVKFITFVYNEVDKKVYLRTANFDANVEYNTITETDFQSYSQLLGKSTSTSEEIIQTLLSGSFANSPIGVDYSGFQNFVFYSSAAERLANFKYKLQQIEHYDEQIGLLSTSASQIPSLNSDKLLAETRKTEIIGSFDGFEKWLYYEPTASLFTHQDVYDREHEKGNPTRLEGGLLAADVYQIQPYPKFLTASANDTEGEYALHSSTSTIATDWYNGTLASASLYDEFNDMSLVTTIPEHIRLDSNNDQYELFVNMIGHHFDILYSYADALAKTYHPIEHPKLGHTKETLYNVAKSMGWKLFNGNQASALWQYKLGKSETGSLASTGSIFTKSDEAITTEVWRRIVNNLPHLLKTKGTARGVKALMNTYGIPQTLLSIREYGGPKVDEDTPLLIEDRFTYALKIASGSSVRYNRDRIKYSDLGLSNAIEVINGVGPGFSAPTNISDSKLNHRVPDTIEFRIKPAIKESMIMLSHGSSTTKDNVHWNLGVQYTGSYSGSNAFGRLFFQIRDLSGNTGTSQLAGSKYDEKLGNTIVSYSDYVPLYDGEFWNVRLWSAFPYVTSSHVAGEQFEPDIYFQTQKASDYISDKIIHMTTGSINFGSGSSVANGTSLTSYWGSNTTNKEIVIGGATGSGLINYGLGGQFSGSIQEYREWLEVLDQKTFDLHTKNPTSYASSQHPTASFDTLIRHYPFGTQLNAVDHSVAPNLFVTSSHPNQKIQDFTTPLTDSVTQHAQFYDFPTPVNAQRGNYEPVEETYYVQGISLGASLPKSQKIRFDDNELITRLSTNATAERSRFDRASLDSNRLGLFYSMADQINKEIFNHVGDVALDDFVGDPDDQYELTYPDLNKFANAYWKKYSDRNDINAYMRIFSQFDFSLFESIRQMLPDRIDEVMGLLVEPHALERAKVTPFKRPEQEACHYETLVPGLTPETTGEYPYYEGAISGSPVLTGGDTTFHVGDNGYSDIGNYFGEIIPKPKGIGTDYFTKDIFPSDNRPGTTGSAITIYSVAQSEGSFHRDADHRWEVTAGVGNIKLNDNNYLLESGGTLGGIPLASDKIRIQFNTYLQTDTIQDLQVSVTHLDNATNGTAYLYARIISTKDNETPTSTTSAIGMSEIPYTHMTETKIKNIDFSGTNEREDVVIFENVHIPRRTNITLEIWYQSRVLNGGTGHSIRPRIDKLELVQLINKSGYSYADDYIDVARPSTVFKKKVLHYHEVTASNSKYQNDRLRVLSESLHRGLFNNVYDSYCAPSRFTYSQSLAEIHYRDDETNKEASKYVGSTLTAPGINVLSGYSEIGFEPIVEIFITNPNQVVYNATPAVTEDGQMNPGNISVTAGPAVLVERPIRPSRGTGRPRVSYR